MYHHDVMGDHYQRDYLSSPNTALSSHNYGNHRNRFEPHSSKRTHRHNFNANSNNRGHRKMSGFEKISYRPFSKVR